MLLRLQESSQVESRFDYCQCREDKRILTTDELAARVRKMRKEENFGRDGSS